MRNSFEITPVVLGSAAAAGPSSAYLALADAAAHYLRELDRGVRCRQLEARTALYTRVRGTGPGIAFGLLLEALRRAEHHWVCPFEGCLNVRGAVLAGSEVVGPERSDAFLLLEFAPHTRELPLHIHGDSDRFVFAIGGRGFFHVSPDPLRTGPNRRLRHMPVRDRDAVMFRRGTVHTFSTAEFPMTLLSYHSPYVPLDDERQFSVFQTPERPSVFLQGFGGNVSFDPAWNVLTREEISSTASDQGRML